MTTTACPPAVRISVEGVEAAEFAAVPTLRFQVRLDSTGPAEIRSVALHTQLRIAAARRSYDAVARDRLAELFGGPEDWGRALRSLLWTHAATQVPAFRDGVCLTEIPVTCTYDFEVVAAKYFHALPDGEVPLEFLFSGTIFYLDGGSLRAARIPWDTEAEFTMPVHVWKDLMDHYFPGSAWMRLDRAVFDRLYAYRVRNTLTGWDDVMSALLEGR
ncbi:DUF6084 family protein [Microtetraspora sp. NBRC 16547]|uniref:DUF6084 family protein n=1 Tax=Microtetraspora sp. NBRC 16547 TaxID=3030993 RepID=UPI0024A2DF76|nr:DUF6084 family protein [Microtetraspora sp. NBRC 16547]GLW99228.1 hypothetical protein Misp02_33150 [Microtetraspora sp. NBRC 16547]